MRILLVEDDRDLSAALKRMLEISRYDVECAYDGIQALDMITYGEYGCIILDVMMPRMDGFTVLKNVRAANNNTPVLILSAKSELEDKVTGLDYGADDYLTKPFQAKELLARVRALLRRTETITESYSIGNVTLDHDLFLLKTEQKSVRLTAKEYKMMETLIRNKNTLLSTERLMDMIWDYDSEAEINVVWAYLSALRKKLEEIDANITIKAVRGVGYKLEEK